MSNLEEMMAELNDLKEIKKTLTGWLKEEANGGKDCFHCESAGAVSDIIKDSAQTIKYCLEAKYYETVIKAMERGEEPSYGGEQPYGYNHRHFANGKFAPSGEGHRVMGYLPYMDQQPYMNAYLHDPNFEKRIKEHNGTLGYNPSRHGEIYDNYHRAKMGYQNSKSIADKEEMDTHHMMYMHDTLKNMKHMWDEADPMLKKRIKEDFGEEIEEVLEKL